MYQVPSLYLLHKKADQTGTKAAFVRTKLHHILIWKVNTNNLQRNAKDDERAPLPYNNKFNIYLGERVGKILIYELTTQRIGLLNPIKHLLPLDVRSALYSA